MNILQTTDLKKYYGTEPNITKALDGVTLSIEEGEFVAIVGTSGSGKSTLLNMMGGLDTPTSGSIKVKGKELSKLKDEQLTIFRRRNIGFIFQNYNLVPVLNVYENIVLPVELDGDTVDKRFMDEVVKMLALDGKLNSMPNRLILTGELWTYLADLNEQAQERLDTIMEQMKTAEGVTEELKRTHQMEWVQRCNNIHNRAEEIVLHEMIYS